MAVKDKIISFWKQVRLRSSDMFTLFKVGIGVKSPTHKLHIKDIEDPVKLEGVQSDTSSSTKFLVLDGSDVIKHSTGTAKTTEEVQDIVGAMFTSNTETGVAATYEDGDGTIDLVVDHDAASNFVAEEHYRWDTDISGTATINTNNITDLHGAGVDGSANQLLTDDGDGTVTSEAELLFDTSTNVLNVGAPGGGSTVYIQRGANDDNVGGRLYFGAGDAGGTDKSGGHLHILAGRGSGNAVGGSIFFQSTAAGSSGSSLNGLANIAQLDNVGNFEVLGSITTGSTLFANSSGVVQVATQGIIDHDSLANFVANEHINWVNSSAGTIHSSNIPTLNQNTTGSAQSVLGGTDADVTITSDAGVVVKLNADSSVDASHQKFQITNSSDTEVAYISELGDLQIDGGLTTGSTSAINSSGLIQVANQSNITGVGTISSGTWQGTVIASAYLDTDTAHLSGTQTFSGTKTFSNTISGSIDGNAATATTAQGITGATDGDVTITSDGHVVVKLDADNDESNQKFKITDNSDAVVFHVQEDGDVMLAGDVITNSGSDNDLTLETDGSLTFIIDRDNDETSQKFSFVNYNAEVANIDEAGKITATGFVQDGDLTVTPGDGVAIHVDSADITDGNTSASGTVTDYHHVSFEGLTLAATNANVTTTHASTVFIKAAPVTGTNQTITNSWALRIHTGASYFGGAITANGGVVGDVTGNVSGSSGSCTGNAATATALTSGDKTIEGSLTLGDTDGTTVIISTPAHDNGNGSGFQIKAGAATAGQTDKSGGTLSFYAGQSTGTGANEIRFYTHPAAGSTGTSLNNAVKAVTITNDSKLRVEGNSITNNTSAANFTIDSSRVLQLQHAGSYNIEMGNSTNTQVLIVEGDAQEVTINGTLELGHATDTTIARSAAGKVSIEGNEIQTKNIHHHFIHSGFFMSYPYSRYIPLNGSINEQTTSTLAPEYTTFIWPYDGYVKTMWVRSETSLGSTEMKLYKGANGSTVSTAMGAVTETVGANTSVEFDMTGVTNSFSQGEAMAVRIDPTDDPDSGQNVTIECVFDLTT